MESIEEDFKEALTNRINEEAATKQKALRKIRRRLTIFELILFGLGVGILWNQTNIYVLLGVSLMIWGNNLSIMREVHKLRDNFYKKVWQDYK